MLHYHRFQPPPASAEARTGRRRCCLHRAIVSCGKGIDGGAEKGGADCEERGECTLEKIKISYGYPLQFHSRLI
eukprot:767088-Hanusia_phi.AAC.3